MSDTVVQSRLIGALFVERGVITEEQLERALAVQAEQGGRLGEILVAEFGISRVELASILAEQWAEAERQARSEAPAPADGNGVPEPEISPEDIAEAAEPAKRRPIGEIFVERGLVTEEQLAAALETQRQSGAKLGEILVAQGMLSRLDLAGALADQWASLQKLRPPEPKPVEPWQQAAPREMAAGSAPSQPAADGGGLASTVAALEDRVRVAEQAAAAEAWRDELRAAADALTARIATLEARLDGVAAADDRAALESVRASVVELRERLDAPDARLDALQETVTRLEQRLDEPAGSPTELEHGLGAVEERVGALEARIAADETRIDEKLAATHDDAVGLGARLDERLATLERRVAGLAAAEETGASAAVGHLASRLDALSGLVARETEVEELRTEIAALRELGGRSDGGESAAVPLERLEQLEHALGERASRAELGAAVDGLWAELAERGAPDGALASGLAALGDRVEALAAEAPRRDEIEALRTELDATRQLATGNEGHEQRLHELASRLDALSEGLGGAVTRDEIAVLADELRARLDDAAGRIDGLAGQFSAEHASAIGSLAERLDALGAEAARGSDVDGLRAELHGELQAVRELASRVSHVDEGEVARRLAELEGRLEGAAPREELQAAMETVRSELAGMAGRLESLAGIQGDELVASLHDVSGRLDRLATEAARGSDVDGLRAELHGELQAVRELASRLSHIDADEVARRLAELEERLEGAAPREELLAAMETVRSELTAMAERLQGPAGIQGDELVGRLDDLTGRLDAQATGVDARLGEVEAQAVRRGELANAVHALEERLDEIGGASARRDELDGIRAELHRLAERTTGPGDVDVEHYASRLDELAHAVDVATRVAEEARQIAAGAADAEEELGGRLQALAADTAREWDLESLRSQLQSLEGVTASERVSVHHRIDQLEAAAAQAGARADEIERERLAPVVEELAALRAALEERVTADRLQDLSHRVDALASAQADGASRIELTALAGDVHGRLDALETQIGETGRALPAQDEAIDGLRRALDGVSTRLDEGEARLRAEQGGLADELRSQARSAAEALDDLRARLHEVDAAFADRDEWRSRVEAGLAQRVDELGARVDAGAEEITRLPDALRAELGERLDGVAGGLRAELERLERRAEESDRANGASAHAALEELRRVADRVVGVEASLSGRVDELGHRLEAGAADLSGLRDRSEERSGHLESAQAELAARLDEVERSLHGAIDDLRGRQDGVDAAIEHAAASIGWRLEQVERALGEASSSLSTERLDAVEARLADADAIVEEQARSTERALRKGLAALGERLTEAEGAYVESGNALRRSIERLGYAIAEADVRISERDDPASARLHRESATGHVAFAPTDAGYRLVALDGPPPALGDQVEVEGRRLRCTRLGRSPLPLDARPCVYLEPVAD